MVERLGGGGKRIVKSHDGGSKLYHVVLIKLNNKGINIISRPYEKVV